MTKIAMPILTIAAKAMLAVGALLVLGRPAVLAVQMPAESSEQVKITQD